MKIERRKRSWRAGWKRKLGLKRSWRRLMLEKRSLMVGWKKN